MNFSILRKSVQENGFSPNFFYIWSFKSLHQEDKIKLSHNEKTSGGLLPKRSALIFENKVVKNTSFPV